MRIWVNLIQTSHPLWFILLDKRLTRGKKAKSTNLRDWVLLIRNYQNLKTTPCFKTKIFQNPNKLFQQWRLALYLIHLTINSRFLLSLHSQLPLPTTIFKVNVIKKSKTQSLLMQSILSLKSLPYNLQLLLLGMSSQKLLNKNIRWSNTLLNPTMQDLAGSLRHLIMRSYQELKNIKGLWISYFTLDQLIQWVNVLKHRPYLNLSQYSLKQWRGLNLSFINIFQRWARTWWFTTGRKGYIGELFSASLLLIMSSLKPNYHTNSSRVFLLLSSLPMLNYRLFQGRDTTASTSKQMIFMCVWIIRGPCPATL